MKKIIFILSLLFLLNSLFSQTIIDSLGSSFTFLPDKDKAEFLHKLGIGSQNLGDYTKALEYFNESLKIHEADENRKGIARALNNIGNIYNFLGLYNKALENHIRSLNIEEELNDMNGIIRSLNNIGNVYQNISDYERALNYYQRALEIVYKINDGETTAVTLNNLGNVYSSKGYFDKALEFYQRSLKIRKELDDKYGIANSYNNIGIAYQGLKKHKKSLEYYQKSLEIMKKINDKHGIASSYYYSGILYFELQNLKKSLLNLKNGLMYARQINDKNIIKSTYLALSKIYYVKNQYKKAYDFFVLYVEIKDNIDLEETKRNITELQIKYETERKEKEIEILKKSNSLKELEARRQSTFMVFLVIGFVLLAILAFFIYNQFRLKAYSNTIIAQQNSELKDAYKKVELLASTDTLTGISNRRDIIKRFNHETDRFERNSNPFSIIMGDVDNFKSINDNYGHDCGDFVLKSISDLIKKAIRKQDSIGRWGGEEFLIILPETDLKGGIKIAEKLRKSIGNNKMVYNYYDLYVTITFGVNVYDKAKDINECIKEADKALYVGKIRNKNCVVSSDEI